ncbi:MAG: hypothetical protein IJ520_11915, partial [Synergistaceae bacterium]|nr:hypothetical protein [Synergistaceae bacterium]
MTKIRLKNNFGTYGALLALLALLILININIIPAGAASMPQGVQSFSPTGSLADNVNFRLVFRNPMINRRDAGKAIDFDDDNFPLRFEPSIEGEGKWVNERTVTVRL